MKTLTKMKKVCCLSRFVLLVMALGMTSIFTSCKLYGVFAYFLRFANNMQNIVF